MLDALKKVVKREGVKKAVKRALRFPADVLAASSSDLPVMIRKELARSPSILDNPYIEAKAYPYQADKSSFIIYQPPRNGPKPSGSGLPVPPPALWFGYGNTAEEYVSSGQAAIEKAKEILKASGFELKAGHRILDFGCAAGRLTRGFKDLAETGEVWGADINAEAILWCQQNLSPPFKFVNTTTFPRLPFPDAYFDLITVGSVFTHIADLADMWLLELGRVLREGGRLFISVHDRNYIAQIMQRKEPWATEMAQWIREFDGQHHVLESNFAMFTLWRTPGIGTTAQAQVFYDIDYLRDHWGQFFKVLSTTPSGHGTHTAVLLTK